MSPHDLRRTFTLITSLTPLGMMRGYAITTHTIRQRYELGLSSPAKHGSVAFGQHEVREGRARAERLRMTTRPLQMTALRERARQDGGERHSMGGCI